MTQKHAIPFNQPRELPSQQCTAGSFSSKPRRCCHLIFSSCGAEQLEGVLTWKLATGQQRAQPSGVVTRTHVVPAVVQYIRADSPIRIGPAWAAGETHPDIPAF